MRRRSLLWRIYGYVLIGTFAALGVTAYYATHSLRTFHEKQVEQRLLDHAGIGAARAAEMLAAGDVAGVAMLCRESGRLTGIRFTAILPSGKVIGDSDSDPPGMDNHASRPEVAVALQGETGRSIRFSDTLQRNLMYIAVPAMGANGIAAVLRTALPLQVVTSEARVVNSHIVFAAALSALLFAAVMFQISRRVNGAIQSLRAGAERMAAGDLAVRISQPDDREFAVLADSMNRMSSQLSDRMQTVTRQRNELEAVFSGMTGGVLTIDAGENIGSVNKAAAALLGTSPDNMAGRSVQEAVRNRDLQEFISAAMASDVPTEGEMVLYGGDVERSLHLHGALLKDGEGKRTGVLVVLNDISRIKQLEKLRHEFVANASHELKTPVTAIKGCVETLSDMSDSIPAEPRKFLHMLSRQVDRLAALIDDLLDLSRIENDVRRGRVALEITAMTGLIERAVHEQEGLAGGKGIRIDVDCPSDLSAPVNDAFMVQAVGNLLNNAVKYSPEKSIVKISARETGKMIEIAVADSGPGIEKKHHERIFERFYRVDPARSRSMGGTGLGLAIVKHITLAHSGTVSVDSTPGSGSVFIIRIPSA